MNEPSEPDDRVLAEERTDLAWNRSGLSLLACGAVVLRGLAGPRNASGDVALGACILGLGGLVWALGMWHEYRARTTGRPRATPADLLPLALGVAIVGVATFGIALFFPR